VQHQATFTAVWTEAGELFTFGQGFRGQLGHGGVESERVPRLVEALVGKKVAAAAAAVGSDHTVVWTDAGELFTFGDLMKGHVHVDCGMLGHGVQKGEYVPRLVDALVGKKVIGASAVRVTAVWTGEG